MVKHNKIQGACHKSAGISALRSPISARLVALTAYQVRFSPVLVHSVSAARGAQLEQALGCLSEHDVHGTRVTIEYDINVNRMDIDLEETCLQLLAHVSHLTELRSQIAKFEIKLFVGVFHG